MASYHTIFPTCQASILTNRVYMPLKRCNERLLSQTAYGIRLKIFYSRKHELWEYKLNSGCLLKQNWLHFSEQMIAIIFQMGAQWCGKVKLEQFCLQDVETKSIKMDSDIMRVGMTSFVSTKSTHWIFAPLFLTMNFQTLSTRNNYSYVLI